MDSLLSDLRFAARALVAPPGCSSLAVLTLAIGIGVNAVAFSALNALLFKPSRFPGADTVGWIISRSPGKAALGVPVVSGHEFSPQQAAASDGVLVSQKLADRLWPGQRAVGEWLREGKDGRQFRVIGVAADVNHHMLGEAPREYLYRPLRPSEYADAVTVIVRT